MSNLLATQNQIVQISTMNSVGIADCHSREFQHFLLGHVKVDADVVLHVIGERV